MCLHFDLGCDYADGAKRMVEDGLAGRPEVLPSIHELIPNQRSLVHVKSHFQEHRGRQYFTDPSACHRLCQSPFFNFEQNMN